MKKHLFELIHGIGEDCLVEESDPKPDYEYYEKGEENECQNH